MPHLKLTDGPLAGQIVEVPARCVYPKLEPIELVGPSEPRFYPTGDFPAFGDITPSYMYYPYLSTDENEDFVLATVISPAQKYREAQAKVSQEARRAFDRIDSFARAMKADHEEEFEEELRDVPRQGRNGNPYENEIRPRISDYRRKNGFGLKTRSVSVDLRVDPEDEPAFRKMFLEPGTLVADNNSGGYEA